MNVCALDVIARAPDFETVASTLELRGWEWAFLHDVDGEASLGELSHRTGVDVDSAIGLVHEAMHRGLVYVPTMTLETYRLRLPSQTALRGSSHPLSLATSAVVEPPHESTASEAAPASSAISFSSDAFDWNAPEPAFEESDDAVDLAASHDAPDAHAGVHYDDRFGVEHPGGPFAVTHQHDEPFSIESHHEDDPFAISSHHADAAVQPEHHAEAPFAVTAGHDVEALVAPTHFDEPFVPMSHDEHHVADHAQLEDPFAVAAHHDEPIFEAPQTIEAPHVAVSTQEYDPFAAAPSENANGNGKAHANGSSQNGHRPLRFDELFSEDAQQVVAHDEPAFEPHVAEEPFAQAPAAEPIRFDVSSFDELPTIAHEAPAYDETHAVASHAVHAEPVEEAVYDAAPGSISFSFSADDPSDEHGAYDATSVREAPEVWTPPVVAPQVAHAAPEPMKAEAKSEPVAKAEAPADPRVGQTQSLYFEREAIDTDAGRELEAKVKNWKDSLSWREQQELNDASATGNEKAGVIGSLLRALGVR